MPGRAENESFEQRGRAEVMRVLKRSLAEVDRALGKGSGTEFGRAEALSRKAAIERAIKNLEGELPKVIQDTAAKSAQSASTVPVELYGETLKVAVAVSPEAIAEASRSAAEAVANVGKGLRQDLNRAVVGVVSGAYDRSTFEQKIRDAFGGEVLEHRVERIARTEISKAFMAQHAANDEALAAMPGVDLIKVWVSSGKPDGQARPEHAAIEGQERELDERFDVGGGATDATPPGGGQYQCMGPMDPSLPADQVIQCGCRYRRVPRSEARQPYIAKERAPAPDEAATRR